MNPLEKSKQRGKNIRKVFQFSLLIVILIPVILLSLFLLSWGNPFATCFKNFSPSYSVVAEKAKLNLPKSVTDIEYSVNASPSGRRCTIWITFKIDVEEISTLLESTLVKELVPSTLDSFPGRNENLSSQNPLRYALQVNDWLLPKDPLLAGYGWAYENDVYIHQWVFIDSNNKVIVIAVRDWT